MAAIIPRWEWRAFGMSFGSAEAAFDALSPLETKDSDELYFLAPGRANVKVRDDLLDIKVLKEVDSNGLERWMPVMKQAFPLISDDIGSIFEVWTVTPPVLDRDVYTLGQFLEELIEPSSTVQAVNVHKHRVRYMVGGCMAELTDVLVDGKGTRTIAVESEVTNYPQGLRRALDEQPDRFAIIDVGTNSVKFHLGERAGIGEWRTVVDRADLTRLGEGLDQNSVIAPEARARTSVAVTTMVDEAKNKGAMAIVAVGTAGLRIA